jgi:hypothetical protein
MEIVDGEVITEDGKSVNYNDKLTTNFLSTLQWRMADGNTIYIKDMEDSHVRNAALFLMGMGYRKCYASESQRVTYLTVFRLEWERRMMIRNNSLTKKVTTPKELIEKGN